MNLIILTLLLVVSAFQSDIKRVQNLLLSEGPSNKVLGEFSTLIKDIEAVDDNDNNLSQLYFKKSLIEINLGKEKDAIRDLKTTLLLDPHLTPAKHKLVELLMEFSLFDDEIFKTVDPSITTKITTFQNHLSELQTSLSKKKYDKCHYLDELIDISPMNPTLYKLKISCAGEDLNEESYKNITMALNKLTKLERDLSNFHSLSNYLLYTAVNFNSAFTTIKQCLRIDNEFKDCVKTSKFFSRFSKFLELLEQYSIENGHIYLITESNQPSINDIDLSEKIDFKYINEFLNEKPNKRLVQGLSVSNNYDYLVHSMKEFSNLSGIKMNKLKFYNDLNKMYCEASIHLRIKNKICNSIEDDFLPKMIPKIDSLLSKQNYQEAERILKSFPVNTRQTSLYKSRWSKIEDYIREQQHRQQQEQQQRFYQQQQQQRQQQQRQQQQQQNMKPKNDYYKVLDVTRDADEKTIKKAYRSQTLKYHPDKYKGNDLTADEIEGKMQEINQAYEVLSDPDLRANYDRGEDPNDPGQSRPNPFQGNQGFNFGGGNNFRFNFGSGGGFQFGGFDGGPKVKFQKNFKRRKNT